MEFLKTFCVLSTLVLLITKDAVSLTLTASSASATALRGTSMPFTLSCTYSADPGDLVLYFQLRKNGVQLATYRETAEPAFISSASDSFKARTNLTGPVSNQISIKFNEVVCDDKGQYEWYANYLKGGSEPSEATASTNVAIKVKSNFNTTGSIIYTPVTNIVEGDEVTFTCTGDVGAEPSGHLKWFYYINSIPTDVSSQATPSAPAQIQNDCNFERTSILRLNMTQNLNNIVVRCTIQQDTQNTEEGDGYKMTNEIPVLYSPRVNPITSTPSQSTEDLTFTVGEALVTLTCMAFSNPSPEYYWTLPDNSTTTGNQLQLTNLTEEDQGNYTCTAFNMIRGQNHSQTVMRKLNVVQTTTLPPTTTPAPVTTETPNNQPATGGDDGDDNKNTIIIVVCVVVGVIIIVAIVIVVYCRFKKKPKEIEEPPEKPRNNQDLSYYGNRPDLVSADHLKNNYNNPNNTSFDNSFDSSSDIKPRNEDGLLYIDLAFDDQPRSRRPVQLVDNNPSYADIAMPRV